MRPILPCLLACLALASPAAGEEGWVLEFGPYSGHYDFDRLTSFVDRALFGARMTVHLNAWAKLDAEFDEVYTRRSVTDNRARQVSLALHVRAEREDWVWSPSLLAGLAFVGLDDAEDPDAYGDAFDIGGGLRWKVADRWNLRADWMLRRQVFRVFRQEEAGDVAFEVEEAQTLWARSLRIGVAYVF